MHPDSNVIFFDLETGGLNSYQHPIIQIGAAAVNWGTLEIVEQFNTKVQFNTQDCDPKSLEINSYHPAAWTEAVPLAEALEGFATLCRRHAHVPKTSNKGKPYSVAQLAAYRVDFDMGFLKAAFRSTKGYLPGSYNAWCLLQRVYWFYGENGHIAPPKDFKLTSVCQSLGVPLANAHDATADNLSQIEVLRKIRLIERSSACKCISNAPAANA